MIWAHRISWVGMALVAFMIVPVIKAESEVIERLAIAKIYLDMSMIELGGQRV